MNGKRISSVLWRKNDRGTMRTIRSQQLLRRLDDIGASLASTGKALALIGLGSVGAQLSQYWQGYNRVADSAQ